MSALLASACGDVIYVQVPGPSPTTTAVAVEVDTLVPIAATRQATATASLSDGTTEPVTAGFMSDRTAVATVSDAGLVTGVANGLANIYVVFGGQQGLRQVRVVPNYAGTWQGQSVIRACGETGVFVGTFCRAFPVGLNLPTAFGMGQDGDEVSGAFFLGEVRSPLFRTTIEDDGGLRFSSGVTVEKISVAAAWQLISMRDGHLAGRHSEVWRTTDGPGEGQLDIEIRDSLERVSDGVSDAPGALRGMRVQPAASEAGVPALGAATGQVGAQQPQ